MSDRMVTVMVTGVGGGGHGEQILKALRLAETAYRVVGSDISAYSAGLAHVNEACLLPPATDPDYIETLLGLCRRCGIEALFHGSEPELTAISRNRTAFSEEEVFLPINPPEVIETCMDKLATMDRLRDLGFPVPPFARVRSIEEASAFDHLPAILKPSMGGGGSANLYLVQDREELVACARQLLTIFDEFIVQEYVGTPEQEFTVGVLSDMDGELINSIAIRRQILSALSNRVKVPNRTGRADLGLTLAISSGISQGEIVDAPGVLERCEQIAASLGARGPLNIQCRVSKGEVYPFEINPRFSGTTSVRAMVGFNEPDLLIRKHVLGQEIETRFPFDRAVVVRSLAETVVKDPSVPSASELECGD
jgi:carbamoyl-phosphate synthase large subunit